MSGALASGLSALFGLLVGLSVQWWKSAREELRVICEDCCRLIAEAADVGSRYWLSNAELSLQEARLVGFTKRISGYGAIIRERLHAVAAEEVSDSLSDFFRDLTGGEFETPGRAPDPGRAKLCQDSAADAVLAIRHGFFDTVSFWRKLERATTRRLPRWHSKFESENSG